MNRYFRRTEAGPGENLRAGLAAGLAAGAVAVVSFYLVRTLLSREILEPLPASREPDGEESLETEEG